MENFASAYPYVKAFHIVFVVSWFVGLFYIVRLFIYHVEAYEKPEPDRTILTTEYKRIQQLLWKIIMQTAAVLTITMGILMLLINQSIVYKPEHGLIYQPWMQVKIGLVLGLLWYHWKCGQMMRELAQDIVKWKSSQLRMWNEVSTIFLLSIVLLVVLQNMFNWVWGIAGIIAFGILLMLAVKLAKRLRSEK